VSVTRAQLARKRRRKVSDLNEKLDAEPSSSTLLLERRS
jgi:hypothetical protein